jgi:putative endonuclease
MHLARIEAAGSRLCLNSPKQRAILHPHTQAKDRRMREWIPCVYILASGRNGTLYIGVTSDLPARIQQHKADLVPGFTRKYRVHTLVWYEVRPDMASAIVREKALKEWKRAWKLELIEKGNPYWRDLSTELG